MIIVGGGPVGLTLAIDLGMRGISCLLLEQEEVTSQHPKANQINTRSMEHFRHFGIAPYIREQGLPPDYPTTCRVLTRAIGPEIVAFEFPSFNEARRTNQLTAMASHEAAEFPHRICQIHLEPILKSKAESLPKIKLCFGWKVLGHQQNSEGVEITARHKSTGREETFRAAYLAACDGAASSIRKDSGISLHGEYGTRQVVGIYFYSQELYEIMDRHKSMFSVVMNPDRIGILTPVNYLEKTWLFHARTEMDIDMDGFDYDSVLKEMAGCSFHYELRNLNPWKTSLLLADKMQHGRVFLAGDAAHVFTPAGGFGMNTGIGDAINLAWKLAAIEDGWGGDDLLESYELERLPIGERNLAAAGANARRLFDKYVARLFEAVEPIGWLVRKIGGLVIRRNFHNEIFSQGIALGYRYENSPICINDGSTRISDRPNHYISTSQAGHRLPHIWMADGSSLYDHLSSEFTLIHFDINDNLLPFLTVAKSRKLSLKVLRLEPTLRECYERDFILVRPDQHVAWRSNQLPSSPEQVLDRIRGA